MTRYVIRKNDKWAVVNANYKKSIKIFDTQKDAIAFSNELWDTKHVVIQGKDSKFHRVERVSKTEGKRTRAPLYVYKSMDKKSYSSRIMEIIIISATIALLILTIIFATLYTMEVL